MDCHGICSKYSDCNCNHCQLAACYAAWQLYNFQVSQHDSSLTNMSIQLLLVTHRNRIWILMVFLCSWYATRMSYFSAFIERTTVEWFWYFHKIWVFDSRNFLPITAPSIVNVLVVVMEKNNLCTQENILLILSFNSTHPSDQNLEEQTINAFVFLWLAYTM